MSEQAIEDLMVEVFDRENPGFREESKLPEDALRLILRPYAKAIIERWPR